MSKEVKVGILTIVSGILLYFGFNFLKGNDLFSGTNKYYVAYNNVDGLTVSNPVIVNGLNVGRVSGIELDQKRDLIIVEIEIKDDFIVGDSTKAILINSDFLGGKAIELDVGSLSNPKIYGDTLLARVNDPFNKVLETTGTVANDIEITISRINEILAGMKGSGEDISATVKGLTKMIDKVNGILDQNSRHLNETILETKETIEGVKIAVSKIDPVLDSASSFVSSLSELDLKQTLDKTNNVLENLSSTIDEFKNSKGTLGKLMNEDSLHNNMNQLFVDLDKLINHLNEYPKDFFSPLGRKHKKVKKNLN